MVCNGVLMLGNDASSPQEAELKLCPTGYVRHAQACSSLSQPALNSRRTKFPSDEALGKGPRTGRRAWFSPSIDFRRT